MKKIFIMSLLVLLIQQTAFTQNVGIGTTNPAYALTVASTSSGVVQKVNTVEVGTGVTNNTGLIKTYSNHPLHFSTYTNTAQMSLTTAGDVGIGTTIPYTRLHVKDEGQELMTMENSSVLDNSVHVRMIFRIGGLATGGIGTYGTASTAARLSFFTYTTSSVSSLKERMSILDNGNVGINTPTPTAKLEIQGRTKITAGVGDEEALEISGAISVSGTNRAAYVLTASANNLTYGDAAVIIDDPDCNNNSSAIVMVTPRTDVPCYVRYDMASGRWRIYTSGYRVTGFSMLNMKTCSDNCQLLKIWSSQSNAFMPGDEFNILIIKSKF